MNEAIINLPLYLWVGFFLFGFWGAISKGWVEMKCSGWKHIAFKNRRTICSYINTVGPFLKNKCTIKQTKQRNFYSPMRMPPTKSAKEPSSAQIWFSDNLALCEKDNLSKKNLNSVFHGPCTCTNQLFTDVWGSWWQYPERVHFKSYQVEFLKSYLDRFMRVVRACLHHPSGICGHKSVTYCRSGALCH